MTFPCLNNSQIIPLINNMKINKVENIAKFIINGENINTNPNINVVLAKQEPNVFPSVNSQCPFLRAVIPTANSG